MVGDWFLRGSLTSFAVLLCCVGRAGALALFLSARTLRALLLRPSFVLVSVGRSFGRAGALALFLSARTLRALLPRFFLAALAGASCRGWARWFGHLRSPHQLRPSASFACSQVARCARSKSPRKEHLASHSLGSARN